MDISGYIDHTILKPEATEAQVIKICNEAKEFNFASVCVNPCYASLVSRELKGTDVKTCVVVGFPLGASTREVKAFEASDAIIHGAHEIDMVINVGKLKDKKYDEVLQDINGVVSVARGKALVKVILECCLLTKDEITEACKLCAEAGADYVKTSTGFNKSGAKAEDVALMKKTAGDKLKVKAAGGIRDYKTAMEMINAGASRIGASAGVEILKQSKAE